MFKEFAGQLLKSWRGVSVLGNDQVYQMVIARNPVLRAETHERALHRRLLGPVYYRMLMPHKQNESCDGNVLCHDMEND